MTRVILVGVGGATCSGKTTLAKHLRAILPDSVIIHQDDFAPPQELVPIHPIHNVQDWDAPAGAITWPRLISFLEQVKKTGQIPPDHRSHDHLNEQKDIPVDPTIRDHWIAQFEQIKKQKEAEHGEPVIWGIVDGFLLYWHPDVINQLDVRIMLRVPHDMLKKRRHERHGYHTAGEKSPSPCFSPSLVLEHELTLFDPLSSLTLLSHKRSAMNQSYLVHRVSLGNILPTPRSSSLSMPSPRVQSDPEGSLWRDPPGYWEDIVYPAYVEATKDVFENGDVEKGKPTSKVDGLILLESLDISMSEAVDRCCQVIRDAVTKA